MAQPRDPLGRFPVGHARVGEAGIGENVRIGLGRDVLVRRVGADGLEIPLRFDRVAPFRPLGRRQRQALVEHGVEHVDKGDIGDDPEEELGRHVGHHAHQHAAGGAAVGDDAAAPGVALLHEELARRDVIGEGVELLFALALGVPAVALVLAAADVGDRKDEAAIDQREPAGGERRRDADAVGAVAVEEQRGGAVQRRSLLVDERDRHGLPVGCRRMQAAGDVVGGVMAARHLLRLAQDTRARLHVVVVDLRRGRHRRVGEAHRRRVELVAGRHAQRICLLIEVDGVLGAIGEAADGDAGQPVLALEPDQVAAEGDRLQDQAARLVWDHLAPV